MNLVNHQNEGLNCGLPVLYLDSGHGGRNLWISFQKTINRKNFWDPNTLILENLKKYPYNSDFMYIKYEELFVNLMERRNEIVKNRKVKKTNLISKIIYKFNLN